MEAMLLDYTDNVEILRPLGEEWKSLAHGIEYGLPLDVNVWLDTMKRLVMQANGDVIVLMEGHVVKGSMGLQYHLNHVGPGKIANECTFFVSPSARGGGLRLIRAARELAKRRGCDFVTWNASRVAGDAERSGKLYEHGGAVLFESSYLDKL